MKKRILFVCLGNICRSPSAEAVMKYLIDKKGLSEMIDCDSAGILSYHEGEMADQRMQKHALRRGYNLTSISRPVHQKDFERFDMIIGMDDQNIRDLQRLTRNDEEQRKVYRMIDFARNTELQSVPDPYYGGSEGFDLVLDLLENACAGLLDSLVKERLSIAGK